MTEPGPSRSRAAVELLRNLGDFVRLLVERFLAHEGLNNAAALTYTTLLSLVPLMAVSLAIFSAFPAADRVTDAIQDFVFANFVPTSGEILERHLSEFSDKATRLTGIGFVFLILVALMMMESIDRALNGIWEVRRQRSPVNKFVIYWSVLSLGPLLIGASVVVSSYLLSLPGISEAAASGAGRTMLALTPTLASTLGFSLIYALVPNRRVPFRHALLGGLLAAVLFELAKLGFGFYVTNFPTYEAIYGAVATVPIFLVWVFMSWVVVLLGAEFTHSLGIYRWGQGVAGIRRRSLADAVLALTLLGEAQRRHSPLTLRRLAKMQPRWTEYGVEGLLHDLHDLHLVYHTDEGRWVLARPLDRIRLSQLVRRGPFELPYPGDNDWPDQPRLAEVLEAAGGELERVLAVTLDQFAPNTPEPPVPIRRTRR